MFLRGMEARLAEQLGKQHQELMETTWEQLKGKEFQGCSYLSLDIHWSSCCGFPRESYRQREIQTSIYKRCCHSMTFFFFKTAKWLSIFHPSILF